MDRIRRYFDRGCRRFSLDFAIFQLAGWSFYLAIALCTVYKYSGSVARVWLCLGIFNSALGVFNVWASVQVIHAVVRRLRSKPPAQS